MNTAERKLAFIHEQIAAGKTVYLSTATRHTKITAKQLDLVRVKGDVLQVLMGKQGWLNFNYARLSAV